MNNVHVSFDSLCYPLDSDDHRLIVSVFTNSQTSAKQNQIVPVLIPELIATLKAAGRD